MAATDLIISEYIEGSSNNKALEFYNGTGSAIDLSAYRIQMFFNGSTSAGTTINLSGIVAAGDVFVLAQAAAIAAVGGQADLLNSSSWFNGDDAIVLSKRLPDGTFEVVDSIGQVGFDPGSEWGSGLTSTADNTLIRNPAVESGDTNPFDAFVPSAQWTGFAQDTFANLGTNGGYNIVPQAVMKPEGDSGLIEYSFTVTRANFADAAEVSWTIDAPVLPADADPEDFVGGVLPSGTVTFAAGQAIATITIQVAGEVLNEVDESFVVRLGVDKSPSAKAVIANDDVILTEIAAIQGAAHISPLLGQDVSTVGIVTARTSNGFWIQDATPDADASTSDGIFVFTGSTPAASVVIGAEVRVTGKVSEFYPNASTLADLSTTQISVASPGLVQLTGNSGTIASTLVGSGGLVPPGAAYGDDDDAFDPASQGMDFWESLEGMIVTLGDAVAVGPSFTNMTFNDSETIVRLGGTDAGDLTPSGGLIVQPGDFNPERIAVQDDNRTFNNDYRANVGDRFGDVTGVMTYDTRGYYQVIATEAFTVTPGGLEKEVSTDLAPAADQLTIASYNAENLAFGNADAKFAAIAQQLVVGLNAPDIVALQEVQDDSGSANDGTLSADATLDKLVAAIVEAGGPLYAYAYVVPQDGADGGQPGGNIRQAFLYNPDRVELAGSTVGSALEGVTVSDADGAPILSASVGRIDPTDASFTESRKPLVAEFLFNGESVFVVNNHFNSKGGDDPLFGTNQPPVQSTAEQRLAQAKIVADFVAQILAVDPDANVVVAGDLNDFGFSGPLHELEDVGLTNLAELLPENERYDYVFDGNSQDLDHILVSGNLASDAKFDIFHVNAEFWQQTSDHDPLIAQLNIAAGLDLSGGNGDDLLIGGDGNDWIDGSNGADQIDGGDGKDELHGGRGSDLLIGGGEGDKLFGEQGDDTLDGGAGNDLLSGGEGNDVLTGGSGADLFIVVKGGGADVVSDFEVGLDSLAFAPDVAVKSSNLTDLDADGVSDLMLSLTGGGSITLLGVQDTAGLW